MTRAKKPKKTGAVAREAKEVVPRDHRIVVEPAPGEIGAGPQLVNISRTGALIATAEPLAIGSMVEFKFPIVVDAPLVLEGSGEVVRTQTDPPAMAVVFIGLTDRSFRELAGVLERTCATD